MRKIIVFAALLSMIVLPNLRANADIIDGNAQKVRIIILGLDTHDDYDMVFDGIQKINGVSDLTLARIASGMVVLTAFISNDEDMFKNDIQSLAADRFSYSDHDYGDTLEITLKKL